MISIHVGFLMAAAVAAMAIAQSQNASKSVSTPIEFVKIAPGEFMMGCIDGDKDCLEDEVPRHKVQLTKGFELGKNEVTQTQWEAVMGPRVQPQLEQGPEESGG